MSSWDGFMTRGPVRSVCKACARACAATHQDAQVETAIKFTDVVKQAEAKKRRAEDAKLNPKPKKVAKKKAAAASASAGGGGGEDDYYEDDE
jgi:hypothetical protein